MPKSHCRQFSHDITSQSRTSAHDTIQSWIEGLPSPGSNVDLLRRQGIGRIQPSKVRQRRPLTELSNNMAPKTPRHKGGKVKGGKGTDHQVSPEKLPTTKRVQGDSASHDETGGDSDIQETPTRQSLRHPFPSEVLPQPTASTNTRPDYGDRPQSPTKMAEMRNLLDPFETEVLTGLAVIDESHTLYAILPLLEDLMQFSRGIGVLDSSTEVISPQSVNGIHLLMRKSTQSHSESPPPAKSTRHRLSMQSPNAIPLEKPLKSQKSTIYKLAASNARNSRHTSLSGIVMCTHIS